jgi:methyl coenzyme M reductase subunit C
MGLTDLIEIGLISTSYRTIFKGLSSLTYGMRNANIDPFPTFE